MSSVFEAIMLLCFAASWPFSILKAIRRRWWRGKPPAPEENIGGGHGGGPLLKHTAPPPPPHRVGLHAVNLHIVHPPLSFYYRHKGPALRGEAARTPGRPRHYPFV